MTRFWPHTTNAIVGHHALPGHIMMKEPAGELQGELKVGNDIYGSSSIATDFAGVRGGYEHFWGGKAGGVMTTVDEGATVKPQSPN